MRITTALIAASEAAYAAALHAREALATASVAMIAEAIRAEHPGATGITIHAANATLTAIHQGGETVWAHDPKVFNLLADDVHRMLADLLGFVRDGDDETLCDFGWEQDEHQVEVFTVPLPTAA
ncbi:hypothetical protein [Streptomyces sp. NRRL S-350]|uniref:hypothetical protein n=1 Tax=Streptomyces sp. NRRL S-350 TaxID=1463902 RepID=UPI0004C20616|nr:hypothetical protein [Streptomyces sp. NRRL S-350]